MSQLCSIRHDIPVTLHTPGAYGLWSVFDHHGDEQSAVLGTRYGIGGLGMANSKLSDYDFFSSGGGISSVAPVLVSWDIGLCHVQLYPTLFEPTAESRNWLVASNL